MHKSEHFLSSEYLFFVDRFRLSKFHVDVNLLADKKRFLNGTRRDFQQFIVQGKNISTERVDSKLSYHAMIENFCLPEIDIFDFSFYTSKSRARDRILKLKKCS